MHRKCTSSEGEASVKARESRGSILTIVGIFHPSGVSELLTGNVDQRHAATLL